MDLSKVTIRNYRAIRESSVSFEKYNVVIGKNDAGKSTLLMAINRLIKFDALDNEEFRNFDESNTVTLHGEFIDIPAELEEQLNDDYYEGESLVITVKHEKSRRRNGNPDKILVNNTEIKDAVDTADKRSDAIGTLTKFLPDTVDVLAGRNIEDETQLKRGSWLSKLFQPMFSEDLFEEEIESIQNKINDQVEEFKSDGTLNSTLSDHNPEINNVRILPEKIDIRKALITEIEVRDVRTEEWIPLSERGSGVGNQFILSLMRTYAEMNLEGDFMVLFEEPENSLHPTAVREMCGVFDKLARDGTQTILSTHSQSLINIVDDGNIILTEKDQNGDTSYEVLTDNRYTAIEEIGARPSDILQSDFVLYVEGPTDQEIIDEIILNADFEISQQVTVHGAGGSNLEHQIDHLKELSQNCSILLDRDADSVDERGPQTDRLVEAADDNGIPWTVLDEVQIERYLSDEVIQEYYEENVELGSYESTKQALENTSTGYNVNDARNMAKLSYDEFDGFPSLEEEVRDALEPVE